METVVMAAAVLVALWALQRACEWGTRPRYGGAVFLCPWGQPWRRKRSGHTVGKFSQKNADAFKCFFLYIVRTRTIRTRTKSKSYVHVLNPRSRISYVHVLIRFSSHSHPPPCGPSPQGSLFPYFEFQTFPIFPLFRVQTFTIYLVTIYILYYSNNLFA